MDKQEKYDELENIVDTLDELIRQTTDKYYIDTLKDIKYEAQEEMEGLEEELQDEQWAEEQEMNCQYERSRI